MGLLWRRLLLPSMPPTRRESGRPCRDISRFLADGYVRHQEGKKTKQIILGWDGVSFISSLVRGVVCCVERGLDELALLSSDVAVESIKVAGCIGGLGRRRRKCRICCGVCLVVLISLAIVAIVLSQTIFKFRDPRVSLANANLQNLSFDINVATFSAVLNVSISADVRVENPNYYDFRYSNSTIDMTYHGDYVGAVELGAGTIRSRKTVDLPAVINVEAVRLVVNSLQDLSSNVATFELDSVISGRVNLAKIYKKHVTAILNCTLDIYINNQTLKQTACKQKIKL